jgi:NACalpha-BTF3-like transcription factor
MVMDYHKCSKGKAIAALRKTNGDAVNAILELSS